MSSSTDISPVEVNAYLQSIGLGDALCVNFGEESQQGVVVFLPSKCESKGHEVTSSWAKVFDLQYERIIGSSDDTLVWRSSYDGSSIPDEQMDEWLDCSVINVLSHCDKNSSILEIGCGNGLIYSRVIDKIASYTGFDTAEASIKSIQESTVYQKNTSKTEVLVAEAAQVDEISKDGFDLAVLNSVIQYFPDLDYFLDVVSKLETRLGRDSVIYLGDVRSLDLQHLFCFDIARSRSKGPDDLGAISKRIARRERELLFGAGLFYRLPEIFEWIDRCQVSVKTGSQLNEMSRYRFEVKLFCHGTTPTQPVSVDSYDCIKESIDHEWMISRVEGSEENDGFVVCNIPNERLIEVAEAYDRYCDGDTLQETGKWFPSAVDLFSYQNLSDTHEVTIENDDLNPGRLKFSFLPGGTSNFDVPSVSSPLSLASSLSSASEIPLSSICEAEGDLRQEWRDIPVQRVSKHLIGCLDSVCENS